MVSVEPSPTEAEPGDRVAASGLSLLGSLVIVARHCGLQLAVPQLVHDHLLEPGQPSVGQLINIAHASGLRATSVRLTWTELAGLGKALPAIVLLRNGNAMVLRYVNSGTQPPSVVLQDPNAHEDAPLILDEQRFASAWTGDVLLFKRDYNLRDEDQPFGIWLLVSQLLRDRKIARDIGISALTLSLLAIAPIMFWRLLIDRVLYYGSLDTFAVLCIAMLALVGFETAFGYLRRYLVLHVTQRVDAKLSTYMFDRVINLPIDFFERMPVGEITRDMSEMHRIRSFLTGQMFGTVLELDGPGGLSADHVFLQPATDVFRPRFRQLDLRVDHHPAAGGAPTQRSGLCSGGRKGRVSRRDAAWHPHGKGAGARRPSPP